MMCLAESYIVRRQKIKDFLKILLTIFLIIILLLIVISKFYYKQEFTKIGNVGILVVMSGSMEPSISTKEMIIIQEKPEYAKNDIITYKDSFGNIITHRIIDIKDDNFFTKGDSNNFIDSMIKKDNIYGKVIIHSKILGFIYFYALKPIIVLAFLIYVSSYIKNFIKTSKVLLK